MDLAFLALIGVGGYIYYLKQKSPSSNLEDNELIPQPAINSEKLKEDVNTKWDDVIPK